MRIQRIAASAITIKEDKILLVRYASGKGSSYLVGPGGGINIDEPLEETVYREVLEETGIKVKANKMLFIEDLLSTKYQARRRIFKRISIFGRTPLIFFSSPSL